MNIRSNVKWAAVSQASKVITQLGGMLIYARLLSPSDFGTMAAASVFATLAILIRDLGTSSAAIQANQISEALKNSIFWLNVGVGAILCLAMALTAPYVAQKMRMGALENVLLVIAIGVPLGSLTCLHQALLERAGAFQTIARIDTISSIAALLIGIGLAINGAGVMSLAVQTVAATILTSLQLFSAERFTPIGRFKASEISRVLAFSTNLTLFNLVNYVGRSADSFVIGRVLGAGELGLYSVAYKLMLFPVINLTLVVGRSLYPVISRLRDSPAALAATYERSLSLLVLVAAAVTGLCWSARTEIVALIFGTEWTRVADLLFWLAPAGFLQSMQASTGTVLTALGRTATLLRLGILGTTLHIIGFVATATYGLDVLVAGYFASTAIYTCIAFYVITKHAAIRLKQLKSVMIAPIACTAVGCALYSALGQIDAPLFLETMVRVGGYLIGYIAVLAFAFPARFSIARSAFRPVK